MKNIKLRYKLISGFSVIILLLLITIGIYQSTVQNISMEFNHLMEQEILFVNYASQIKALMLESRRNEKDFILRLNNNYALQLDKKIQSLVETGHKIQSLAIQLKNKNNQDKASKIIQKAQEYQALFHKLTKAWKNKGLDNKSGLQGTFNKAVFELAQRMKQHQIDDLYLSFLRLWINEANFNKTGFADDRERLTENIEKFKQTLTNSTCHPETIKQINTQMYAYEEAFKAYIKDEFFYSVMKVSRENIEENLNSAYVPKAGELVLEIRKNEKDYLLWNDKKYLEATHQAIDTLFENFEKAKVDEEHSIAASKNLQVYQKALNALAEENKKIKQYESSMQSAAKSIETLDTVSEPS